ncbi:MAG: hypothetical protein ACK5NC_03560 [Vibrio sp.]
MTYQSKIDDLEHQIYLAYAEGDYQQASQLEKQLKRIRGTSSQVKDQQSEPYSLEGHVYVDDD